MLIHKGVLLCSASRFAGSTVVGSYERRVSESKGEGIHCDSPMIHGAQGGGGGGGGGGQKEKMISLHRVRDGKHLKV